MRTSVKTTKRRRTPAAASRVAVVPEAATPESAAPAPTQAVTAAPAAPAPETAAASAVVALPSVCTVKDAARLKDCLCAVADESSSVTLDVRAVERIDTAIFQLLYAFVRDRGARDLQVAWLGAPSALLDAAALLGVHALLKLPEKEIGAAA
jgi:ABC-type transporter Mla MlaB component